MEDRHRDIIQDNYKILVDNVNINALLPALIQKKVFSWDQAENYKDKNRSEKDRKRDLFMDIQRRGPKAFDNLISALKEIDSKHEILAYKLEGKEIEENENNNYNEEYYDKEDNRTTGAWAFKPTQEQRPLHIRQLSHELPNSNINLSEEPLKIKVRKAVKFLDDRNRVKVPTYAMRSKNRGLFLCINNIEFVNKVEDTRKGAEFDEENLKTLFKEFGFIIQSHRNLSYRDMKHTIERCAGNSKLREVDCIVVAVMSHGREGETRESSEIATSDVRYLQVSWILEQFNNRNCQQLINKPKIFIFQICRGSNLHTGVRLPRRVEADGFLENEHLVRDAEDMLIAFSTLPGDKSYRDPMLGTWYIQAICKIFMENAHDTDIENLLKLVDVELKGLRSADGNMQTSSYENRGFKICYLHPGLYSEKQVT